MHGDDGFVMALAQLALLNARKPQTKQEDPAARTARIHEAVMTCSLPAVRLWEMYEERGKSAPGVNALAKRLGVKASQVRAWQRELVEAGVMKGV